MQDLIIPVNNEAMARALTTVVGEQNAQLILTAYKALDEAMVFAYERGAKAALKNLKELSDEEKNESFEAGQLYGHQLGFDQATKDVGQSNFDSYGHGFEAGKAHEAADNDQLAYENGYVDGVSDARGRPWFADEQVAQLCEVDAYDDQADLDGFDGRCEEFYEGDSGDEQPTADDIIHY